MDIFYLKMKHSFGHLESKDYINSKKLKISPKKYVYKLGENLIIQRDLLLSQSKHMSSIKDMLILFYNIFFISTKYIEPGSRCKLGQI